MYRLQVKSHFDAAHYIKDYVGKCSRMHGHRWEVEVVIEGKELDGMNMLVDFGKVKSALEFILDANYDHYLLNERFFQENVTAEFLAAELFRVLGGLLNDNKVKVVGVTVWESPDCCVKYYGEE